MDTSSDSFNRVKISSVHDHRGQRCHMAWEGNHSGSQQPGTPRVQYTRGPPTFLVPDPKSRIPGAFLTHLPAVMSIQARLMEQSRASRISFSVSYSQQFGAALGDSWCPQFWLHLHRHARQWREGVQCPGRGLAWISLDVWGQLLTFLEYVELLKVAPPRAV